jgi:hypothetical protein
LGKSGPESANAGDAVVRRRLLRSVVRGAVTTAQWNRVGPGGCGAAPAGTRLRAAGGMRAAIRDDFAT